jgi:NADPH2:quinone reductase
VLNQAAAGGVGHIAVQLARRAGARVLGTASSDEKAARVRALGAEPLAYGDDLAERVRELTGGRGVVGVRGSVGKATQRASFAVLAPFGHLVFFGDASGFPEPIAVDDLYPRSNKVSAYTVRTEHAPEAFAAARRTMAEAVSAGGLQLQVSHVLPLARAADAHRALESRASLGKIVLSPGG